MSATSRPDNSIVIHEINELDLDRLAHGVEGEAIELARFGKRTGSIIVVQLAYIGKRWRFDIRAHFFDEAGKQHPTKRGVSIPIDRLDIVADAIAQARDAADKAGLLTVASSAEKEGNGGS